MRRGRQLMRVMRTDHAAAAPVRGRPTTDHGSALLLVPAAVLVLLVLASLAVDAAIVFAAQRQLVDAASAAANDAVVAAVDDAAFYECGAVQLDQGKAQAAAESALAARGADIVHGSARIATRALPDGRPAVTVAVDATVTTLFRPALGSRADEPVSARVTAVAERQVVAPSETCGP